MHKTTILKSSGSFSDFEKHEIIKDYLSSGKPKDEIWRKYTGRADHGYLIRWMRDLGYLTVNTSKTDPLAPAQCDPLTIFFQNGVN